MSAGLYPYVPDKVERQVLCLFAAEAIMPAAMMEYNGFRLEDCKARLPRGVKRREIYRALYRLERANYLREDATHVMREGGGTAICQVWHLTPTGLRVALGVLG